MPRGVEEGLAIQAAAEGVVEVGRELHQTSQEVEGAEPKD